MFCIVREFLEYFNLLYTISVYEPESYLGSAYDYNRQKLLADLGLNENSTVPILLQLIRIAQNKNKNIEINLNLNGNKSEESVKTEINTESSKSISKNVSPNTTFNMSGAQNQSNVENKTFDLSHPSVPLSNHNEEEKLQSVHETPREDHDSYEETFDYSNSVPLSNHVDNRGGKLQTVQEITKENDDTYEETSSIGEDSVNSSKSPKITNGKSDKLKLSKARSSLNSLSDLPPLSVNKTRMGDIIPSLHNNKYYKERELNKLFNMDAEYEEDFMCGDLSLSDASHKVESQVDKSVKNTEVKSDSEHSTSKSISENLDYISNATD